MRRIRDSSACHDGHLCQIILESHQVGKVIHRTLACVTKVYEKNLRAGRVTFTFKICDMVLRPDIFSCHDNYLCPKK